MSDEVRLPLIRIDTLEDFEQFLAIYDQEEDSYGMKIIRREFAACDEQFFEKNSLMFSVFSASSGSLTFEITDVTLKDGIFCVITSQTNNPSMVTCDQVEYLVSVSVSDRLIESCTDFDAYLTNYR